MKSFDPTKTYVHFGPSGDCEQVEVTDAFWPDVMSGKRAYPGRMMVAFTFEGDWSTKEIHPAGDELVVVQEGAVDLVLIETPPLQNGEQVVSLKAGDCAVIPKGVWHTARNARGCCALFFTQGEGTESVPL